MTTSSPLLLTVRERVRTLPATFTAAQARAAGIRSRELRQLCERDVIYDLTRGVYRRSDAPPTAHENLLAIAARAPVAVICGHSALALHGLTDDTPATIHIAVPHTSRRPTIDYPPVTVSRYEVTTFHAGIQRLHAAPGEYVHVYSPARSVVDAIRLRHHDGQNLALQALNRYLRHYGQRGLPDLHHYAQLLNTEGTVRSMTETLMAATSAPAQRAAPQTRRFTASPWTSERNLKTPTADSGRGRASETAQNAESTER